MTPAERENTISWAARELPMAAQTLADHQYAPDGFCACGRAWPCSQREAWVGFETYVRARLALAEATMILPVIAPRAYAQRMNARVEGGAVSIDPSLPRRGRFARWLRGAAA